MTITFTLNGEGRQVECAPAERLLDLLRTTGMLSVKEGCGEGECGACSILLDGVLCNACLIPAIQVDGSEILTVEGTDTHPVLSALREAYHECAGSQCGICTPGMLLASAALLLDNPEPDEAQIREALAGNLCRCTGYVKIVSSVQVAAKRLREASCGA